jgi:tellurite methyltransferase
MITEPNKDWSKHYTDTHDYPPSPLLVEALPYVTKKNKAIDIGGGALKDTRYLLSQGFETTVIDQAPQLAKMAESIKKEKLHFYVSKFINFDFPANRFDVASAMYALPFSLPVEFGPVFTKIKKSLVTGGIFVGNFFGKHDDWHKRPSMTFHTKQQVEALLVDMDIILLQEKEFDGKTADGRPKHWHIVNVIARKRG